MRVLELIDNLYVVELNVEILIDALEGASDLDVVLELDRHLVVDERLEEAVVLVCSLAPCVFVSARCFSACCRFSVIPRHLVQGEEEQS